MVVGAALAWATGSFLSSRLPLPADVGAGTAIEMVIGGAVLAVLAVGRRRALAAALAHASADSLLAIVYLASVGSILAFTAYVWLLQNVPISKISTYAYVNPVVAVVLGALDPRRGGHGADGRRRRDHRRRGRGRDPLGVARVERAARRSSRLRRALALEGPAEACCALSAAGPRGGARARRRGSAPSGAA